MRIDRYLRNHFGQIPQSLIEKNLRNGKIKLNKKKIKSSTKVKTNDHIELYNFEFKSANKILIKWKDEYGRGWLEVNYSNNNFQGTWGLINNDVFEKAGDWNGRKIISTDNIELKLQKLKSFFEDELITQEEYDAKRKEILDEL